MGQGGGRGFLQDYSLFSTHVAIKAANATRKYPSVQLLHAGRVRGGPADSKPGKALLTELRSSNSFYATPFGSNDDW